MFPFSSTMYQLFADLTVFSHESSPVSLAGQIVETETLSKAHTPTQTAQRCLETFQETLEN